MICPNKRLVGVNVDTERMEVEEESLVSDEIDFHPDTTQECDNLASLEIEELICNDGEICTEISPKVLVDGKDVYKALVVKRLMNGNEEKNQQIVYDVLEE